MRTDNDKLDLIWGAAEIAKVIGRTTTQTHYLLRSGKLPAKQVGQRWVVSRRELAAFFHVGGEPTVSAPKQDPSST